MVVDTLRRDHLGCYGYPRGTSPFLDELAAESVVFERAHSQSAWTAPSVAALLTSRFPEETGVAALTDDAGLRDLRLGVTGLAEDVDTGAEIFARHGYRTLAVSANRHVSDDLGLLRGFQDAVHRRGDAREIVDLALRRLSRLDVSAPVFLYLHVIDPHVPTRPPPEYVAPFAEAAGVRPQRKHQRWLFPHERVASEGLQEFRRRKLVLYDAEIAFVDDQLRRLRQGLIDRGSWDRTVFTVTSDHGEEFWDSPEFGPKFDHNPRGQGAVGHGHSLLSEIVDVPWILRAPGLRAERVHHRVSGVDMLPTLLRLAAIPAPEGLAGRDALGAESEREQFLSGMAQGRDVATVVTDRYKYLEVRGSSERFLFDLVEDPAEERNLVELRPEVVGELANRLGRHSVGLRTASGYAVRRSQEAEDDLRELGYLD